MRTQLNRTSITQQKTKIDYDAVISIHSFGADNRVLFRDSKTFYLYTSSIQEKFDLQ